jgi:hypothetical protein
MARMYFRNKNTQQRFEVISLDRETSIITLKGQYSTFTEEYSKEKFREMGYILEKDKDDAK